MTARKAVTDTAQTEAGTDPVQPLTPLRIGTGTNGLSKPFHTGVRGDVGRISATSPTETRIGEEAIVKSGVRRGGTVPVTNPNGVAVLTCANKGALP